MRHFGSHSFREERRGRKKEENTRNLGRPSVRPSAVNLTETSEVRGRDDGRDPTRRSERTPDADADGGMA